MSCIDGYSLIHLSALPLDDMANILPCSAAGRQWCHSLLLLLLTHYLLVGIKGQPLVDVPLMSNTNIANCDNGPHDMTTALTDITDSTPIPRYCIPNPVPGGQPRCYYLFVPACATDETPLVMNIHGTKSCPAWSSSFDRWSNVAQEECFAIMYPIGTTDRNVADSSCFSFPGGRSILFGAINACCCSKDDSPVDYNDVRDLEVLRDMIVDVYAHKRVQVLSNENASLDAKRIYMAGHSNGCFAATAMSGYFSDMVAAVACHSGFQLSTTDHYPIDARPVPTMLISGAKDSFIFPQVVTSGFWALVHQSRCRNTTILDIENGMAVETTAHVCLRDFNIRLLMLNESGHFPFQGAPESNDGASPTTLNTTERAWEFCSNYSKVEVSGRLKDWATRQLTSSAFSGGISWLVCINAVLSIVYLVEWC